jgi:hypothetical protein
MRKKGKNVWAEGGKKRKKEVRETEVREMKAI